LRIYSIFLLLKIWEANVRDIAKISATCSGHCLFCTVLWVTRSFKSIFYIDLLESILVALSRITQACFMNIAGRKCIIVHCDNFPFDMGKKKETNGHVQSKEI